jgi:hypothetical protein
LCELYLSFIPPKSLVAPSRISPIWFKRSSTSPMSVPGLTVPSSLHG